MKRANTGERSKEEISRSVEVRCGHQQRPGAPAISLVMLAAVTVFPTVLENKQGFLPETSYQNSPWPTAYNPPLKPPKRLVSWAPGKHWGGDLSLPLIWALLRHLFLSHSLWTLCFSWLGMRPPARSEFYVS